MFVNVLMTALLEEMAEEIPDALHAELPLYALWADLARIAGGPVPATWPPASMLRSGSCRSCRSLSPPRRARSPRPTPTSRKIVFHPWRGAAQCCVAPPTHRSAAT
jgi:hypothetical protein